LGTDSLASNEDQSLFSEMRNFHANFPAVRPEEIVAMTTRNPAVALGLAKDFGRLVRSARAEFISIPFNGPAEHVFEAIVDFQGTPWLSSPPNVAWT
jgi:cytosine/adenosine deaminase-related metal-dependent hydrolase